MSLGDLPVLSSSFVSLIIQGAGRADPESARVYAKTCLDFLSATFELVDSLSEMDIGTGNYSVSEQASAPADDPTASADPPSSRPLQGAFSIPFKDAPSVIGMVDESTTASARAIRTAWSSQMELHLPEAMPEAFMARESGQTTVVASASLPTAIAELVLRVLDLMDKVVPATIVDASPEHVERLFDLLVRKSVVATTAMRAHSTGLLAGQTLRKCLSLSTKLLALDLLPWRLRLNSALSISTFLHDSLDEVQDFAPDSSWLDLIPGIL